VTLTGEAEIDNALIVMTGMDGGKGRTIEIFRVKDT
jgi:hypothetical protein